MENKKVEKWLPKSAIVNQLYISEPEFGNSLAKEQNKRVIVIEIIEDDDNAAIAGSRYEHIVKSKVQDVLENRVRKIPFLPIFYYVKK